MDKAKYLDGLRGLAALIVVFTHFVVAFYPALYSGSVSDINTRNGIEIFIAKSPLNLIFAGNFAVCIFFITSGYVLTFKYFKYKNHKYLVASAIKRYFRLLIPVFTSIFIAYLLMKLSLFSNKQVGELTRSSWWFSTFWAFAPNLINMLKQALFGALLFNQSSYNVVVWTMTYELYGSFLVFGLASLFGKVKNRYIIYIFSICFLIKTYYFGFILGLFLCDLDNNSQFNLRDRVKSKYLIGFTLLIGLFFGSFPRAMDVSNTIYGFMKIPSISDVPTFYHTLGAFLVILSILLSDKLKSFLSGKTALFLGKISYSMYLIHLIIMCSFSSFLFLKLILIFSYFLSTLLTFIPSMLIIIILSFIMYRYIDLGGIGFANFIYKKYFLSNEKLRIDEVKDITS